MGLALATSRSSGSSAARVLPWWIGSTQTKHAVDRKQLVADRIGEGFVVDGRLRLDAGSSERFEDADEAAVLRGRVPTRGSVTAREDGNFERRRFLLMGVHAQAPRRIVSAQSLDDEA